MTQCDKQKICLLHWLSATNKNSVCCSDSVWQTIPKNYTISLSHITKKLEKMPKTNIHPNVKFTSAIKLLWGTLVILNFKEVKSFSKRMKKIKHATKEPFFSTFVTTTKTLKFSDNNKKKVLYGVKKNIYDLYLILVGGFFLDHTNISNFH